VGSKPESAVLGSENWDCTLSQSGSSGVNFMSLLYCASFLLFLSVSVAAYLWGDHIVSLFFVFFAGFVAQPILSQIVSVIERSTSEEE
jgi:hypothetical protein